MERESNSNASECTKVKVIKWEDYVEEVVRLWSLRSSVATATAKRDALFQQVDSQLQVRKESLSRSNELESMHRKLERQRQSLGYALLSLKEMSQKVQAKEEKLTPLVRSLSGAAKALSAACGRLQEANRLLAEGGNGHHRHLKKMLLARQQLMVTQVASLYPIAHCVSQRIPTEEPKSGECAGSSSVSSYTDSPVESLTIAGLQLFGPPLKKLGFFNDKQEFQSSATALGYVAHIVKLIALYLDFPLRYPLRLAESLFNAVLCHVGFATVGPLSRLMLQSGVWMASTKSIEAMETNLQKRVKSLGLVLLSSQIPSLVSLDYSISTIRCQFFTKAPPEETFATCTIVVL
ncbi:hypothetical protein KI387_026449, partial [Taxus chinensis]